MNLKIHTFAMLMMGMFVYATPNISSCHEVISKFANYNCHQDESIGQGGDGVIFLITHKTRPNEIRALKVQDANNPILNTKVLRGLKIQKSINSHFVVQIFDYTQTPDFIYIIMEFASQGNLRSFIRKYPKLFKDPKICLKFIFKLLLGVQAIHDAGYVHGNLKDLNIVIDKELNPKIIDLDRVVKINERYHVFYNRRYLPPEMVRRKHIDFRWSLDVYVIGTSLFEMVQNGDFPFPKNGEIDRVEAIIKGTNVMNHRTNVSVLYLIFRLMHPDPRCRFTPKEAMIYIHEMIQNIPKQNFKIPNLFSSHKIPNEIVSFVFPKYRQIVRKKKGFENKIEPELSEFDFVYELKEILKGQKAISENRDYLDLEGLTEEL